MIIRGTWFCEENKKKKKHSNTKLLPIFLKGRNNKNSSTDNVK